MKILALETSCERGSVALGLDGQWLERPLTGSGSGHSASILPAVKALLAEAGVTVSALDAVAFGAGPGAFTGVRLACAVAQGLALGGDCPVAAIDSLEALADPCEAPLIYCATDARMSEVYVASFRRTTEGFLPVLAAQCASPDAVPVPSEGGWLGWGSAFRAYPSLAERLAPHLVSVDADRVPTASAVGRLAAARPACWADAALAAPRYVRDRVALTVAERLAQGGRA